jgi:hypothetical protein
LLGRLDRHEPHRWPPHRFRDRLGIGGIGLAPLDIGFDVSRWHQLHLVTQGRDLARPEVARAAGLHTHQTRLQLAEERDHLAPAQRPADDHLAGVVNTVKLKHVLGQIEADSANIHGGWLLLLVVDDNHHFGT